MKNKGFTLIELLVVSAIIALLASIVITNLADAQARSRDTKRVADLQQIQKALELYYTNTGGIPDAQTPVSSCVGNPSEFATALAPLVAGKAIQNIAKDPAGKCWFYATNPGNAITCNGKNNLAYVLFFQSERSLNLPTFIDNANGGATFYCLTNG